MIEWRSLRHCANAPLATTVPPPAKRLDHTVGLQLIDRASDGVRVNGQLLTELSDTGQQMPWTKRLFGDGEFDLLNDLQIDRHTGGGIDRKKHKHRPSKESANDLTSKIVQSSSGPVNGPYCSNSEFCFRAEPPSSALQSPQPRVGLLISRSMNPESTIGFSANFEPTNH